jgi:hypothetical protein
MMLMVAEYVSDRVHELCRRVQQARMVVVVEDSSAPQHEAIERTGDPNAESLHPARKSTVRVGFHEQVQVIAEHGEFDHA